MDATEIDIEASTPVELRDIKNYSPSNFSLAIGDDVPVVKAPPSSSFVKTIRRRGNVYVVPGNPDTPDSTEDMINDLYNETLNLSVRANSKARRLKFLNVLSNIYLVISGAVIGVLTLNSSNEALMYTAAVLGFAITAIQTLMTMFSIEKRGVTLMDISHSLRKMSRKIKALNAVEMKPRDKMKKLEEYYTEIDELDLAMFDNSTVNVQKPDSSKFSNSDSSEKTRVFQSMKRQKINNSDNSDNSDRPKETRISMLPRFEYHV